MFNALDIALAVFSLVLSPDMKACIVLVLIPVNFAMSALVYFLSTFACRIFSLNSSKMGFTFFLLSSLVARGNMWSKGGE